MVGGLLVTVVLVTLIVPEGGAALAVAPLLATAFALGYVGRRALLGLMAVSALAVVVIAIVGEVERPALALPDWLLGSLRVSGLGAVTVLVLLLLWQFSGRLTAAMARTEAANAALRAAEEQVGAVNEELRHRIEQLEANARELGQLERMGDLLAASVTPEDAYQVIAKTAGSLFGGDSGALFVLADSRTLAEAVVTWGEAPPGRLTFAPTECWALRRGRAHAVEDPAQDLLCPHVAPDLQGSSLCVPLIAQSEALGVWHLESSGRGARTRRAAAFAHQQRLAQTATEHIALAVANLRLRSSLHEQSVRDPLTGLYNRRFLEQALDREVRRAGREAVSLGVIMADLDHLKRLNDEFGHAAGDAVLRAIGAFLAANVRTEDVVCRYGGEEFALLLPKASLADAGLRAEALRAGVAGLRPGIGTGAPLPVVTMSFGVAAMPDQGSTGDGLLGAADAALYRAKAEGRDRVVLSRGQPPTAVPIEIDSRRRARVGQSADDG
jgi:diguanylate cyclase (GGDEF)-like protein